MSLGVLGMQFVSHENSPLAEQTAVLSKNTLSGMLGSGGFRTYDTLPQDRAGARYYQLTVSNLSEPERVVAYKSAVTNLTNWFVRFQVCVDACCVLFR